MCIKILFSSFKAFIIIYRKLSVSKSAITQRSLKCRYLLVSCIPKKVYFHWEIPTPSYLAMEMLSLTCSSTRNIHCLRICSCQAVDQDGVPSASLWVGPNCNLSKTEFLHCLSISVIRYILYDTNKHTLVTLYQAFKYPAVQYHLTNHIAEF